MWIAPLSGDVQAGRVQISAPNQFMARWVENHLLSTLRQAAAHCLNQAVEETVITIRAGEGQQLPSRAAPLVEGMLRARVPSRPDDGAPKQGTLPLPARTFLGQSPAFRHSFENFVVGESNNFAVAATREICAAQGDIDMLFVNASPGLGKTHLSHAAGQLVNKSRAGLKIAYLTAEQLSSLFIGSLRRKSTEDFKNELKTLDLLLLEDVHFFQGKEKLQDMMLLAIKSLRARGGKVIFTSTFSPRELQKVDSQLVSHFCSGLLATMSAPTQPMRREILQRKARSHQVKLPDELCDLLASRLSGDIRQLESCLNNMIFKAKLLKRGIDTPLALEVLQQFESTPDRLDMDTIINQVCQCCGLGMPQLSSRSRRSEYVLGRNAVFYLARKYTNLSLQQIGDRFKRRHSTVLKGITSLERELARESRAGQQMKNMLNLIERNVGLSARA